MLVGLAIAHRVVVHSHRVVVHADDPVACALSGLLPFRTTKIHVVAEQRERMSRAARTARGAFGAFAATLIAAASHALAGGDISVWAVGATAILALPICVLLAGRTRSIWRLSVAIVFSQGLYHWSFAGIGSVMTATDDGTPMPLHAQHLAALGANWAPAADTASSNVAAALGVLMLVAHGVAALLTIVLLSRGEHALLALRRLCDLVIGVPRLISGLAVTTRAHVRPVFRVSHIVLPRVLSLSAISHRGPPLLASKFQ